MFLFSNRLKLKYKCLNDFLDHFRCVYLIILSDVPMEKHMVDWLIDEDASLIDFYEGGGGRVQPYIFTCDHSIIIQWLVCCYDDPKTVTFGCCSALAV